MILFGYIPKDLRPFGKYSTSDSLKKIWGHGIVQVDVLNERSINYVVGYLADKLIDPNATVMYHMSTKPAIGDNWLKNKDFDKMVINGKIYPMPKRHWLAVEKINPPLAEIIKKRRLPDELAVVTKEELFENSLNNRILVEKYKLKALERKRRKNGR